MNILVWTDRDLDGAGSALAIKWLYGSKADTFIIHEVTVPTISGKFKGVLGTLDHYDKIYILDLDLTSSPEASKVVDRDNVVIIDHHNTHVENKHRYKKAKVVIESYSSCTKLICDKFKAALSLTDSQKQLVDYIDGFDCFDTKKVHGFKLNAIYRGLNNPKAEKFINSFYSGFREYSVHEKNCIKLYFKKLKEQIQNAQIYKGNIKDYSIVATFADYAINEVAHFIIQKHNADIGIIVNTTAKTVSFRRAKGGTVDVSILAKNLCNGSGSTRAAGGPLTDEFISLTKTFTP